MHLCLYCHKEYSNAGGLGAHAPFCKLNPSRRQRQKSPNAHAKKGSTPWNKNKVGIQVAWNKGIIGSTTGKGSTPEAELARKRKIQEKAIANNGGYRRGSGRGKKGWYNGYFCDSSWELAYVIYCIDHHIDIKRNTAKLSYIWEERTRSYIPDFLVNGQLTEIKGYRTAQWEAKLSAHPEVNVLYESDMKPILRYVVDKYGKDYIHLYEGR